MKIVSGANDIVTINQAISQFNQGTIIATKFGGVPYLLVKSDNTHCTNEDFYEFTSLKGNYSLCGSWDKIEHLLNAEIGRGIYIFDNYEEFFEWGLQQVKEG